MRDTAEQRAHEQAHKKGSDTDHPRQALTPGHPGQQRRGSQPTNNSQQKRTTARSTAIMARKQQRVRPTKSTSREEQQWRARQSPLSMTTPSSRQRRSPHRTDNGAARGGPTPAKCAPESGRAGSNSGRNTHENKNGTENVRNGKPAQATQEEALPRRRRRRCDRRLPVALVDKDCGEVADQVDEAKEDPIPRLLRDHARGNRNEKKIDRRTRTAGHQSREKIGKTQESSVSNHGRITVQVAAASP